MPINQYDELLAQAAPASTNPYDRLVGDNVEQQQNGLRISMHAAAKGPAPDQAAKNVEVADRLKVPVEMVERHPELFTAQDQIARTPYDEILRQSPNLAEWLQQPNNAAVAHDDLENLGLLEWLVTAPQRAFRQGEAQVEFGQLRAKSLFGDLTADEHARLDELRGQMDAGGALGAAQSWFRKAVTGTASQIPVLYGATVQGLQRGIPAGVTAGTAAAAYSAFGGPAAEIASVPTMFAGGMTAGMLTGGAEFTFQMEAGLAYDEYLGFKDELGRPIDPAVAKAAALATGVANAGLESFGLEKLARTIPGVKGFEGLFTRTAVKAALARPTVRAALATAVKEYGGTLTAETAVEVAQRAVTILSGELGKTATNVSSGTTLAHRGAGDIAQDLENEATGALQSFALMVAPGPLAGFTHEARQAREAQHNVTLFTALGDTVKASKLAQRLPEAAQAFVAQATKDGAVETVYAPVDTWTTYWQSKGVDPAEMATELTGDPEAYARAQRSGEDLAIPTAAYAVKLAPTEHNSFFANELRLGPEQMNAREAAEFTKQIEKVAGTKDDTAAAGAAGPVREAIVTQLEAAGFDRSIAETYAAEYEQPFTALAQRMGTDPAALFARYGLQVAREDLTLEQLGGPSEHEIPASTAPANETADQGRARRTAHTAALTAAIVRDAQQQDPGVDVETLTREVHDRLSMYQEGQHQAVDSGHDAGAMLRAIAEHGGLTADARTELYRGELAHLAEFQDRGRGRGASRTWRGVSGVFTSSGLSPDAMVEALREQGFSHVTDINALLDEVEHALSTKQQSADASRLPGTADLPELGIQLGARWWDGASKVDANRTEGDLAAGEEGDTSFEFNQGAVPLTAEDLAAFADSIREREGLGVFDLRLLPSGDIQLETIAATQTGRGAGTRAMESLTAFADAHRRRIVLSLGNRGYQPLEDGAKTSSRDRLRRFYRRFGFVDNRGRHKDYALSIYVSMYRAPADGTRQLNQSGISRSPQTETPAFKTWFGDSKVVDANGAPMVVYHGTMRLDRFGPIIEKRRATSGPMPFFTEAAAIASNYAVQKPDTSIEDEARNYNAYYRLKVGKTLVNLDRAWWFLTAEQRARIAELAPRVMQTDSGDIVLGPEGHDSGLGGYDQHIKEARGNDFAALIEEWLNSASLFDDEARFAQVLELAGAPMASIEYHDPHAERSGVVPAYLSIEHPLVTDQVPSSVIEALERRAKKVRKPALESGADFWDKLRRDPREWVQQLKADQAEGVNSFVWSSIPDWVTKELEALGFDGIKDTGGKMGGAEHVVWVPFEPGQVKSAIGNRGTFDRNSKNMLRQGNRGSIRFGKDRQFRIDLLRNADLSTFLHETGHFYLEVLGDLSDELAAGDAATLTPMQQQLRDDYTTLLQWLGAADRGAITEAQHEQFARGFEAYLFEGKAPSVELRSAFSRFRAWLKAIYRTLVKLNVTLTPEVRGVFDRLHATDAAIAAAQQEAQITPLFTDATRAGMTELEFASYLDTVREASQRAQEELQARVLSELTREEQTWWQTERDAMRTAVEQEITQQPVYRALSVMRTGTLPDGTPFLDGEQPRPIKLSKDSLVAQFGKGILEQLPKPWLYAKNSGIAADTAAQLFGFSSGDELIQAVIASRPLRLVVDEETERRMLAKFGDVMHDGQLQQFARTVVEGQHRETVVRAELQALTKGMTRETIPSADVINHAARERIAATKIREIRPGVFLMASRRASQRAFDLLATGADRAGAVQAKLQELVNLALYRAARDAKEQIESERRVMQAYRSPAARARFGKAGGDHLEQIDALLDRFELAKVPQTEIERRVSLAEYVKRQEGEGLPIDIPQDLLNEARRINYQDVTVDEFHGVYEAVEHIAHIARLKRELLKNEKSRNFEEVRDRLVGSVLAHNDSTKRPLEFRPSDEKWRKVADWFASHAKIGMLARALDAHEDGGEFWEQIIRPLNAAATLEQTEREKAAAALKALVEDAYPGRELAALNRKVFIAAIGDSLSKEARLAVALNWGNEGNRSRLLNDPTRHWNEAQIFAVLGTLDARDLRFVRGVWSLIDSYWPQIEAKQKRVTGLAPEKVEAAPFEVTTADGVTVQLPGGYYPLAYDGRLVARAGAFQDANEAELLKQANYVRATTRRGHTEARQDHVRLSVKLELGVLFAHVDQVIHDLTHHETLIDVSRLLGDHHVQAAILETKGDQVYAQFKTALKDIAIGSAGGRTILDAAASWMRTGTQISMMGWNLWTALQQPLGLFNGMERVGVRYVARGMGRWLRDAASMQSTAQWIYSVSPAMASRHKTATADLAELRTALTKPGGWFDLAVRRVTVDTVTQQDILDTFLWHIGQAQKIADIPTWLGGYEKAMEEGNEERRAIALADQAVLDSQGGGQIKDLSAIERGGPIARALMAFYSYGNTIYNRTYANIDRFRGTGSVGELLGGLSLLYLFPAIGTVALAHAVGKSDDDDWLGELAKELLSTALNTMVLVREVGGAAQIALGMNPGARGYEGPAGLRPISTAYEVATQVNQGKADRGLAKAALEAAGILFRFPALQVQRTVDGFTALAEGRTRNPLVVFTGAPRRAAR